MALVHDDTKRIVHKILTGDLADPQTAELNQRIERDAVRKATLQGAYSECPQCHKEALKTTKKHANAKGCMGSKGVDTYIRECVHCKYMERFG